MSTGHCGFKFRSRPQSAILSKVETNFRALPYTGVSLFGGLIMSYIGAPNTFRFLAVNAAICALTYGFFQCLYVRPRKNREALDSSRKEKANLEQPTSVVASTPVTHAATVATNPPLPSTHSSNCPPPSTTPLSLPCRCSHHGLCQ